MFPGRDQYYGGEGFPLRFKVETSDDPEFNTPQMGTDFTQSDFPDPADNITRFTARGQQARYVRLTVTRLRPVKEMPGSGAGSDAPDDSPDFTLTLAKIAVVSPERGRRSRLHSHR